MLNRHKCAQHTVAVAAHADEEWLPHHGMPSFERNGDADVCGPDPTTIAFNAATIC